MILTDKRQEGIRNVIIRLDMKKDKDLLQDDSTAFFVFVVCCTFGTYWHWCPCCVSLVGFLCALSCFSFPRERVTQRAGSWTVGARKFSFIYYLFSLSSSHSRLRNCFSLMMKCSGWVKSLVRTACLTKWPWSTLEVWIMSAKDVSDILHIIYINRYVKPMTLSSLVVIHALGDVYKRADGQLNLQQAGLNMYLKYFSWISNIHKFRNMLTFNWNTL